MTHNMTRNEMRNVKKRYFWVGVFTLIAVELLVAVQL
jgi:hypothetical protein